jgi:hypothetical protein
MLRIYNPSLKTKYKYSEHNMNFKKPINPPSLSGPSNINVIGQNKSPMLAHIIKKNKKGPAIPRLCTVIPIQSPRLCKRDNHFHLCLTTFHISHLIIFPNLRTPGICEGFFLIVLVDMIQVMNGQDVQEFLIQDHNFSLYLTLMEAGSFE